MKRIADDDAYETIVDKLGVRLPAVDGNSDEIMASANLLEKSQYMVGVLKPLTVHTLVDLLNSVTTLLRNGLTH